MSFLFVVENSLDNLCSSRTGSIPCRCSEKLGESGTAHHSVGSDLGELLCGEVVGGGNTAVSGIAHEGDHCGVAVAADHDAFDFVGIGVEAEREIIFEAGTVKSTAHADDAVLGRPLTLWMR